MSENGVGDELTIAYMLGFERGKEAAKAKQRAIAFATKRRKTDEM